MRELASELESALAQELELESALVLVPVKAMVKAMGSEPELESGSALALELV